jgi:hypothetical protein
LADLRAFRERMLARSVPLGEVEEGKPRPIALHRLGHEVAAYPGTMDDLLAQLAEQGAPSPQPVVFRGQEAFAVGQMVAVQSELGVLVGTAEGVSKLLDCEAE